MKIKAWFRKFVAGLAIGVGAAIPGVSGAAIAVILRVYEDIIAAVNNFRRKFGWALTVLIPILLGIAIAVVICIITFSYAFEHLMFVLICAFAGFLIGSFPGITDEVKGEKLNKKNALFIVIGIIFVAMLGVLSVILGLNNFGPAEAFLTMPWWLYLVLIPVGAIAAVALIVPGLSGSFLLLLLGFYRPLVDYTVLWTKEILGLGVTQSFTHVLSLLGMLGCFAIGCLLGVIFIAKLMNLLLEKYRTRTFFTIIGFVLGSIVILFFNYDIFNYYRVWIDPTLGDTYNIHPLMPFYFEMLIALVVLVGTAILSYLLIKAQRKHQLEVEQEVRE
jgi:putative membrane protein